MIKVLRIVCGYHDNNTQRAKFYNDHILKQSPEKTSTWNDITLLDQSATDYDLTVRYSQPEKDTSNTIHVRGEPDLTEPWRVNHWNNLRNATYSFDFSSNKKHMMQMWLLPKTYDQLKNTEYYHKNKNVSLVSSNKYPHRNNFVKSLITKHGDDVDYAGNIFNDEKNDRRFSWEHRESYFTGYNKSICIENCQQYNYWTEKITDCLLSWSMPLYWGCPNIQDFLPEGSYRTIDLNDLDNVKEAIDKPISSREIAAIAEARDLIMNKYTIWGALKTLFE